MSGLSVTEFGTQSGVDLMLSFMSKGKDAPIQENWTGYPACLDPKWTVGERLDRLSTDGKETPISGDGTARWDQWRATGAFPRYSDIPSVTPKGVLF